MYYVYILMTSRDKSYIGCTNNLKKRIERHSKGYVSSTKNLLPVRLVSYFAFNDKNKAYSFERYLKTGSGRIFLKKRILN
ncbi:MAG: GIY-YIG nuclease family protein [bacterium]|nr:GIY-YIG nuclease family protein [bacterium]